MNTLYLVGLGICDERDLPLKSVEALKKCDKIFAEKYTNIIREGTIERIEKLVGKEIEILKREDVEGEKKILDVCGKNKLVALIVPGDAMSATTHISLLQTARKNGIETRILHASSIITAAAGAAGLQIYKFGKTITIPYWKENYTPASFVDVIKENLEIGAHTLCLLDIDEKMGGMKPSEAIEILKKAQQKQIESGGIKKPVIGENAKIFVLFKVGWEDEKIWAGKIREYEMKGKSEPDGPAVIIICGKMHFTEEENWDGHLANPFF
ncbi:MAG: diphthine synthase [Candidatus Micrarchaeota archaeon]